MYFENTNYHYEQIFERHWYQLQPRLYSPILGTNKYKYS